jgi:hypothetical protein
MWLVLAEAGDEAAAWAAEGLWRRGLRPLRLLTGYELSAGTIWEHRLDAAGVRTRLQLRDGTEVVDTDLRGVLNRLTGRYVPPSPVCAEDADYAACEYNALLLSWLTSLPCPVLNRPGPVGMAAGNRSPMQWRREAQRVGLPPAPPDECSMSHTVFAVAGQLAGDNHGNNAITTACARLSRSLGATIIAIELSAGPRPGFRYATQLPDLRSGGPALLDVIVEELR